MHRSLFFASFVFLILLPAARADLDPELEKPYRLQVVLHIPENRFLTRVFQEQVQRSLRDDLQLALGPLAAVEVVRTHPLLAEIEAHGLESTLDKKTGEIADVRTCFVLVDYAAGVYTVQARQHDGLTGLPTPVVRRGQTSDRALVARLATQLIERDFGLVGTVTEAGKDIRLGLRGGKLAAALDRWLSPGDIFMISRLSKEGNKAQGRPVPWALLEVLDTPRDGMCRCRLFRRFQEEDLKPAPGVLGYRALKLATRQGPVQIRLLDEKGVPLDGVQVHAFRPDDKRKAEMSSNRDGLAVSRESFKQFVIVHVLSGDTIRAQLPIPLVGDRPVVVRLKNQLEAEAQAPIDFRKDQWVSRIYDDLRLASHRVAELNKQLESKSLEAALAAAQAGLTSMESELTQLEKEREEILRQAAARKIPAQRLDFNDGDLRFGELKERRGDLANFIERLQTTLKESKSEKTLGLAKLLERAKLLETEADFEQAIALYKKVLAAAPDQHKVREQMEKLEKRWMAHDDQHREARAFIYETWPKLDVSELNAKLDKAEEALKICKERDDHLTPLKMLQVNVVHVANLKKRLQQLRGHDSEDNRNQAKVIAAVAERLGRLHAEAKALTATK